MGNAAGKKCVIIVDPGLPAGLVVNASAVLAVTLGSRIESIVGPGVADASGGAHAGLVNIPIPVLKADAEVLRGVRSRAAEVDGLLVVGFTGVAQTSRTYEEYTKRMAASAPEELEYLGVALYGTESSSISSPGACRFSSSPGRDRPHESGYRIWERSEARGGF